MNRIINNLLTFFNVSLRIFKMYDAVFLDRRGEIGWEKFGQINPTSHLKKNTVYNICYREFGKRSIVCLNGVNGNFHPNHFIKIYKDSIAGVNIFQPGDIVEVISIEKIGWENYNRFEIIIGQKFKVTKYTVERNAVYVTLEDLKNKNKYIGFYHPNHFKK